jgi:hypothetical protein
MRVVTGVRVEHHRGAAAGESAGRAVRLGEQTTVLFKSTVP